MTALPAWIVSAEGQIVAATVKRKVKGVANGTASSSTGKVPETDTALATDLMTFIRRYVVMDEAKLLTVALWIVHTHCFERFEQTPYLAVTSPEKQCGKSRLLEVLSLLVRRPWMLTQPSEAVVFRNVHAMRPTMLLDETDAIFNPKTADRHEGLRAMLNAGHRKGTTVPRCLGGGERIMNFRVYCPKVLAGIGTLPDTVSDRAVPVRLQRKTRDEPADRFIYRDVTPAADALKDRIEAWVEVHEESLGEARPEMPEELSDRMQEGCEPLIAIADHFGVGPAGRGALVELLTGERLDNAESMRLRLLRDLRAIFDAHPNRRTAFTDSLITKLHQIEEAPWETYYGRGLEPRDLASLLRTYEIQSTTVRVRGVASPRKGYRRDDLEPVWKRYL